MIPVTALVVSGGSPEADSLHTALRQAGVKAWQVRPEAVAAGLYLDLNPDLILVSADVDTQYLASIHALARASPRSMTLVTFGAHDAERLQEHLQAGLDYLVPPFVPELLGRRLSICLQNRSMNETIEEMSLNANLLKYERELQIGREIQHGFLPDCLPRLPGWDLEVRFNPAREVAGDFYDSFHLANGRRIGLVIADVCDKGVGAALFMALIRTLIRHTATQYATRLTSAVEPPVLVPARGSTGAGRYSEEDRVTSEILFAAGAGTLLSAVSGTDSYMTENHLSQGYFATLFFGILDPATGHFLYINGGHNPPVLISAAGERRLLQPTGPAVGILPDSQFRVGELLMDVGDSLFLYTDGVTEARSSDGAFFGEDRMFDVLTEQPIDSAAALLDRMDAALVSHVGTADQFDDITMMALRRAEAS